MEKSIAQSVITALDFSSLKSWTLNLHSFDNSLSLRNIFPLILSKLPICLGWREAEGHSRNRSGRCIMPETNSWPDFEGTACDQYLALYTSTQPIGQNTGT